MTRRAGASRQRVVLTARLFTPEVSAASSRLRAIAVAFTKVGLDVEVLTTRPPAGAGPVQDPPGVRVRRWPVLRDAQQSVRGYAQYLSFDLPLAVRLLTVRRPNLVVCEPPPTTGLVVRAVCSLRHVPYAWFAADVWTDGTASAGAPRAVVRAVRAMESRVLRGACIVLSVNAGVTNRLRALGVDPARVLLVGNGVDTDVFTFVEAVSAEPAPQRPGAPGAVSASRPPAVPYAVYAGTMSEWQGADVFVRGFAHVLADLPHDARLVFLGSGSAVPAVRAAAAELAPGRVDLLGLVPPREAARWQRQAVCALVSIVPGQGYDFAHPTKIWAATATGTPVIFAGVGPAAEQVRDAGLGQAVAHDTHQVGAALVRAFARPPDGKQRQQLATWTLENASLRKVAHDAVEGVLAAVVAHDRRRN